MPFVSESYFASNLCQKNLLSYPFNKALCALGESFVYFLPPFALQFRAIVESEGADSVFLDSSLCKAHQNHDSLPHKQYITVFIEIHTGNFLIQDLSKVPF